MVGADTDADTDAADDEDAREECKRRKELTRLSLTRSETLCVKSERKRSVSKCLENFPVESSTVWRRMNLHEEK